MNKITRNSLKWTNDFLQKFGEQQIKLSKKSELIDYFVQDRTHWNKEKEMCKNIEMEGGECE